MNSDDQPIKPPASNANPMSGNSPTLAGKPKKTLGRFFCAGVRPGNSLFMASSNTPQRQTNLMEGQLLTASVTRTNQPIAPPAVSQSTGPVQPAIVSSDLYGPIVPAHSPALRLPPPAKPDFQTASTPQPVKEIPSSHSIYARPVTPRMAPRPTAQPHGYEAWESQSPGGMVVSNRGRGSLVAPIMSLAGRHMGRGTINSINRPAQTVITPQPDKRREEAVTQPVSVAFLSKINIFDPDFCFTDEESLELKRKQEANLRGRAQYRGYGIRSRDRPGLRQSSLGKSREQSDTGRHMGRGSMDPLDRPKHKVITPGLDKRREQDVPRPFPSELSTRINMFDPNFCFADEKSLELKRKQEANLRGRAQLRGYGTRTRGRLELQQSSLGKRNREQTAMTAIQDEINPKRAKTEPPKMMHDEIRDVVDGNYFASLTNFHRVGMDMAAVKSAQLQDESKIEDRLAQMKLQE